MSEAMHSDTTDHQRIGCAGEFLTAGKLFKRGFQVAVTYGNAKAVDLVALHPSTSKPYVVQVKTQHKKNCFPMRTSTIERDHVYVFVRLNRPAEAEEFFIVQGQDLLADLPRFFGSSVGTTVPAVNYGSLLPFQDNWAAFDDKPVTTVIDPADSVCATRVVPARS